METQGFYKKDVENNSILFAPDIVEGNNYVLRREDHADYTYPIDGWIWAEDIDSAMTKFVSNPDNIPDFTLSPEGFTLGASREDEAEFTKFTSLLQLAISQNKMSLTDYIKIKDSSGIAHPLTIERFFAIMVDYGMYCYVLRSM